MLLKDFDKEFAQALAVEEDATFPVMGTVITFPADIKREDFDRMKAEIQAVIYAAEIRGEQKALAFMLGDGTGEPIGIIGQPELNDEPLGEQ